MILLFLSHSSSLVMIHVSLLTNELSVLIQCLDHRCVCVCVCVCVCAKSLQSCSTLCSRMDCSPPGSSVHGDSPGKNPGVGCHALLQGILWTQGSNLSLLCLLHWQAGSLPLVPPGKPGTFGAQLLYVRN